MWGASGSSDCLYRSRPQQHGSQSLRMRGGPAVSPGNLPSPAGAVQRPAGGGEPLSRGHLPGGGGNRYADGPGGVRTSERGCLCLCPLSLHLRLPRGPGAHPDRRERWNHRGAALPGHPVARGVAGRRGLPGADRECSATGATWASPRSRPNRAGRRRAARGSDSGPSMPEAGSSAPLRRWPLAGRRNSTGPGSSASPGSWRCAWRCRGPATIRAAVMAIGSKSSGSRVQYAAEGFVDAFRVGEETAWGVAGSSGGN